MILSPPMNQIDLSRACVQPDQADENGADIPKKHRNPSCVSDKFKKLYVHRNVSIIKECHVLESLNELQE